MSDNNEAMINGKVTPYDYADSNNRYAYTSCELEIVYLGQGYVYSCNGTKQHRLPPENQNTHFWRFSTREDILCGRSDKQLLKNKCES